MRKAHILRLYGWDRAYIIMIRFKQGNRIRCDYECEPIFCKDETKESNNDRCLIYKLDPKFFENQNSLSGKMLRPELSLLVLLISIFYPFFAPQVFLL